MAERKRDQSCDELACLFNRLCETFSVKVL